MEPEILNEESAEIGAAFVGHVTCEEDMEDQYVSIALPPESES